MISVIPYSPEHLSGCADLYRRVFSREPWNETWERPQAVEEFLQRHSRNSNFLGYVAMNDGDIVGASIGFLKPWIRGEEYYIDEYFVDADLQGQGIGTALMTAIRDDLRQRGIPAILLNTERTAPAYRFYRKLGFEEFEGLVILAADT